MSDDAINRKIATARNHWFITGGDSSTNKPHDWTGSEDASAVLLEEMPDPMLWKESETLWGCEPFNGASEHHRDRKVAIALGWMKWKGIE